MQLRSARLAALLAVTALAAGTLTACVPEPDPDPAPRWTASASPEVAEPLFASDEEALAAAEAAYAEYQRLVDVASTSGGVETAGLDVVSDGAALERALADAEDFREAQIHSTGATSFTVHKAQSLKYESSEGTELRIYVCDDVSAAGLWASNGDSLVDQEGSPLIPFEITVAFVARKGLVLVEKNYWKGTDFCAAS